MAVAAVGCLSKFHGSYCPAAPMIAALLWKKYLLLNFQGEIEYKNIFIIT